MEEEKSLYKSERFYLDRNSYIAINWNKSAFKDDMLKIVIGAESVIIPRSDLEMYMLYLAKDPSRFIRSSSKTVGTKYVPVKEKLYDEWQYNKKQKGRLK